MPDHDSHHRVSVPHSFSMVSKWNCRRVCCPATALRRSHFLRLSEPPARGRDNRSMAVHPEKDHDDDENWSLTLLIARIQTWQQLKSRLPTVPIKSMMMIMMIMLRLCSRSSSTSRRVPLVLHDEIVVSNDCYYAVLEYS